jgi:hypothetical protein
MVMKRGSTNQPRQGLNIIRLRYPVCLFSVIQPLSGLVGIVLFIPWVAPMVNHIEALRASAFIFLTKNPEGI